MPPAGSPTVDPISPVTAVDLPPGLEINPETGVISGTIDPSASQVGPYDVTVTAVDPDGNQVSTTFPFDVTNPAPVAGNDQTATTPDTPVIQPANGTVTINPDGTLEYTPDAGFTGPDTFTYIVTDNEGGFSTATVTIEVSDAPSSEIPTATEIPNVDVIDGEAVPPGTSVVEFFDDPNGDPNGDPLIYTATGLPDGVELDPNTGELTGSVPSDASVDGPYDVTVTATDPDGNTITETFTIVSTNPAPVVENDATETTPETPVVIDVLANDGDPDGDDAIIASTTPPTHGEVSINPDGTLTYTPDDGFIGEDTFTYTIDDGQGGTEVATVIVNVTSSPEGPIANPALPEQSATDGEDVSPLDASQAFSDVESDTLTFTANDLPEGLSIDPNTGLITGVVDPDASQLGTDPINTPGVYLVEVIATDPNGNEATVIVTYNIENQPPVAVDDNASAIEDTVQTGNVLTDPLTADADGDPDSDPLIVTEIAGQPIVAGSPTMIELTNGTLEMSDDGAWSFTPNGNANVLGDGETLIETITYMIDDGQGGTDEAELTITIEGANDPVVLVDPNDPQTDPTDPTYDPGKIQQTPSDPESLVGTLTGTDDLPFAPIDLSPFFGDAEGDPITFTAIGLPEGLQIDPQTGIISGTPSNDASADGPYNVTIIGTDPQGNTAELPVTIEIENQSPVLDIEVPDYTVYPGAPLQIPVSDYFSDPDLDTLTYTATGLPAGFTLDPSTGLISGDADPETVTGGPNSDGVFEVTVTIGDGQGGIVTDTFLIEVLPQAYVASPNVEAPIVREFPLDVQQSSSDQLPISNLVNSLSNLGPQIGLDADIHPVDAVISQLGDPAVGVALDGPHYIDELARYLDELIARDSADAAGFGAHGDDSHPYLRGESSAVVIPGQDSVLLQSMIWRGEVYIEMLDSYDGEVFGDIRGYRVTGPNGSDLPIWINQRADNFLQIDRPANVEVVAIEVHTTLSDGSVRTIDLIIDLVTGEMQSSVENDVVASENSTFNQRLATLAEEPQRKQSALLSALKTHSV
ncbi:hypothetical protein GQR58_017949 [Nymphon striatum]|nr:hypothetical protein GQR58_017949 [Nymphon striatum]